jgi:hypothetical protein
MNDSLELISIIHFVLVGFIVALKERTDIENLDVLPTVEHHDELVTNKLRIEDIIITVIVIQTLVIFLSLVLLV